MMPQTVKNGKKIAEQIAKESDSEKLVLLVKELCDALTSNVNRRGTEGLNKARGRRFPL
jgi:hypothetical protein